MRFNTLTFIYCFDCKNDNFIGFLFLASVFCSMKLLEKFHRSKVFHDDANITVINRYIFMFHIISFFNDTRFDDFFCCCCLWAQLNIDMQWIRLRSRLIKKYIWIKQRDNFGNYIFSVDVCHFSTNKSVKPFLTSGMWGHWCPILHHWSCRMCDWMECFVLFFF